jgi:preprotein translocase subunit SecE
MNRIKVYVIEAYRELTTKVSWPTLADLQRSAIVVLAASMIIALILMVMDLVSSRLLGFYYGA